MKSEMESSFNLKGVYHFECYDKHGNLSKVETPTLSELAKKDLEHLKNDKIFKHWMNYL